MRQTAVAALVAVAAVSCFCARPAVKPDSSGEKLCIFVSNDIDYQRLAAQADIVRRAKASGDCIWLVVGSAFGDREVVSLTEGGAPVAALDAAGVDAVLLRPEWLTFGAERCRELADEAGFYLLSANLTDSNGPVGRDIMVRGGGQLRVGLSGLWLDSSATEFRQAGLTLSPAEFTGARVGQVLKGRADLTVVLAGPRCSGTHPYFDLTVTDKSEFAGPFVPHPRSDSLARYDITLRNGQVVDLVGVGVAVNSSFTDAQTVRGLDSLGRVVDSLGSEVVVESRVAVPPAVLARAVARHLVGERLADHVVYDALVRDTIRPGVVTLGRLVSLLENPGRLLIAEMTGSELKELRKDRLVQVETRQVLKQQRQAAHRRYTVAMTAEFAARHPELRMVGHRLAAVPLWQQAATMLRKTGGKQ